MHSKPYAQHLKVRRSWRELYGYPQVELADGTEHIWRLPTIPHPGMVVLVQDGVIVRIESSTHADRQ